MAESPGFTMYKGHANLINQLTDEQAGRVFKAILCYTETGKIHQLDQGETISFLVFKDDIDRSEEKYQETCARNRKNISKRWENAGSGTIL